MRKRNLLALLLSIMLVFSYAGCSDDPDPVDDGIENGPGDEGGDEENNGNGEENDDEGEDDEYVDDNDVNFHPNPQEVDVENGIFLTFSDGGLSVENQFENSGVTITNDNGHVTIYSEITDVELDYVLSGTVEDGSVKIYGNYKFNLYLNGLKITNPRGAAINNQCGKKTTVVLVDQTSNLLIDGEDYVFIDGEDMKGTFFSEGQLIFRGNGELIVRGRNRHAICSDDYIRIESGSINVKEAVSDALHPKDYFEMEGGTLTTRSESDGIDTDGYVSITGGNIDITTTGDKGHGIKSGEYMTINNPSGTIGVTVQGLASKALKPTGDMVIAAGTLNLVTRGDAMWDNSDNDISSAAAIKGDGTLTIENCDMTIISSGSGGKGINVEGDVVINGGNIKITTTGDQFQYGTDDTAAKALRSKGNLTINDGIVIISTSKTEAEGIESKDVLTINGGLIEVEAYDDCLNASNHIQINGGRIYCNSAANDGIDSNGTLTITGGTIVSAGTSAPEAGIDCDNSRFEISGGVVVGIGGSTSTPTASACEQYSVIYGASSGSSEIIRIESSAGSELLTFKSPQSYSRFVLLFSSPEMESNTSYVIKSGGTVSGGTEFHGLYFGVTYSGGSQVQTFTTSSKVTSVGSAGGGNPGGGGPGGNRP